MLFNEGLNDSLIFKGTPNYIGKTDKNGIFHFPNLKSSNYKIVALTDFDFIYNKQEKIAFLNRLVNPEIDSFISLFAFDPIISIDSISRGLVKLESDSIIDYSMDSFFTQEVLPVGRIKIITNEKISEKIVIDLFDGVETDLEEKVRINSKKELLVYSYRVAGTVGLMMSKILKVKNKEALKGAIDLGIAMQLTNIARDVCEDRDRNRQYIKPDFSAIKETINESQIFYQKSFSSISSIPLRSRFSVIVARRVYKKIGDYILKQNNSENYNKDYLGL